jgi:hypothetical protein
LLATLIANREAALACHPSVGNPDTAFRDTCNHHEATVKAGDARTPIAHLDSAGRRTPSFRESYFKLTQCHWSCHAARRRRDRSPVFGGFELASPLIIRQSVTTEQQKHRLEKRRLEKR